MNPSIYGTSQNRYGPLLDLISTLGELTSDFELMPEIPRVLVSLLPLDRVVLAITGRNAADSDHNLVCAAFESGEDSSVEPCSRTGIQDDLAARESDPAPADESPGFETGNSFELPPPTDPIPNPFKIVHQLDADHKMILILHWGRRLPSLSAEFVELLRVLDDTLTRFVRIHISWRQHPELLGARFATLTPAEWRILCHLTTERSEKELAASSGISPHTLHCHVKSTYAKLMVRSRMEAVRCLRQAARYYRIHAGMRVDHARCAGGDNRPNRGGPFSAFSMA
jgi:DNA-binding CsgD family transcriptional regulator